MRVFKPKYLVLKNVTGPDGEPVMVERVATKGTNKGKPVMVPHREPVKDAKGRPTYRKSEVWWVQYKDASGVWQRAKGYTDKEATQQLGAKLQMRSAHEHSGLIDRFEKHRKTPLTDHVEAWKRALTAKGNSPYHVEVFSMRVGKIIDGCGFTFWPEVEAGGVQQFVSELKFHSVKAQTRTKNFYTVAFKSFCVWAVRDQRIAESPVAHLQCETVTDEKEAGIFEPGELRTLIDKAKAGPVRYRMSGQARAILFQLAAETGYRQSELRTVTCADVLIEAKQPCIRIVAGRSKNKREHLQPIKAETAQLLARWRTGLGEPTNRNPLFLIMPSRAHVVRMLRADMAAAKISETDSAGRKRNFHSLRHTFVSMLARNGTPLKLAMDLARHSDPKLTMKRYSHTFLPERASAIENLPDLNARPESQPQTAIGA